MVRYTWEQPNLVIDSSVCCPQRKVEELNRKIEKETQLKNLTALNLTAALESTTKSMASDKVSHRAGVHSRTIKSHL